jgi:hypothetical protein
VNHWDVIDVADEKLKLELQDLERRDRIVHTILVSARKGYTRIVHFAPVSAAPQTKRPQ